MTDMLTVVDDLQALVAPLRAAGVERVEVRAEGLTLVEGASFALLLGPRSLRAVTSFAVAPDAVALPGVAPALPEPPAAPEPEAPATPAPVAAPKVKQPQAAPDTRYAPHGGRHKRKPNSDPPTCDRCGTLLEPREGGGWVAKRAEARTSDATSRFSVAPEQRVAPPVSSSLSSTTSTDPARQMRAQARGVENPPTRPLGVDPLCTVLGCHGTMRYSDDPTDTKRKCDECGATA